MLKLKKVSNYEEFKTYKHAWQKLLSGSNVSNIFLTYDWIDSCIKNFCKFEDLLILNIFEDENLTGIAPLMIKKYKYFGLPVRSIRFIGTSISDRMDFIICGDKEECLSVILDYLVSVKEKWDFIDLQEIAGYTGTMDAMDRCVKKTSLLNITGPSKKSFFIEFNKNKEEIYNKFSKKYCAKLKKIDARKPGLNFEMERHMGSCADKEKIVTVISEIEKNSWKGNRAGSLFSEQNHINFHKDIFEKFSNSNWLDISILNLNKKPVAYIYNYFYESRSYNYSIAYDERFADISPGTVLMFWVLKDSVSRDIMEFDFARGEGLWKSRFTEMFREHNRVRIFKPGAYSGFLYILQSKVMPYMKNQDIFYNAWMKIKGAFRWD